MRKTIIQSPEHFSQWCESNWQPVMALDFETTGLIYTEMEIVGFSLANGKEACYVDVCSSGMTTVYELDNRIQLTDGLVLIMHKAVYDMKCLSKFLYTNDGFTPFCTLVGAKLIDETLGKGEYSLKRLANSWLNIPTWEIATWEEVSKLGYTSPEFINYAMNDAIWAWDLYELEKRKLKEQNLEYVFNEIEMPFQFVVRDMEINGVLVDQNRLKSFEGITKQKLLDLEAEMLDVFGLKHHVQQTMFGCPEYVSPINFDSSKQLVDLIEYQLKFVVDVYTKPSKKFPEGQKSVGIEYIEKMRKQHKFFDLLWWYKKYKKLLNGFINPAPGFIESDGRIRPSFQLVRSGRLSASEPNLHQLPNPKKTKLDINYREIFVAGKGNVFVKGDWAGQELRVLGEVSKDENLIAAFNDNIDVHLLTANSIFKLGLSRWELCTKHPEYDSNKKKYSQERHKAKNGVNFPVVYGTSPMGISKRMGVSRKEAKSWMDEFFGLFPGVKDAIESTREFLEQHGYIANLMGRRRRYPGFKHQPKWEKARMLRSAFNHRIQGFSAEAKKIAAVKCLAILYEYGAKVVLEIHDELVFEVPEPKAKKFAEKLKEIMENSVSVVVPLPVDISIVKSLGE